jgi:hypothetical protein
MVEVKRLAEKLYQEFDHTADQFADWPYEIEWAKQTGKDVWTYSHHARWLKKAEEILTFMTDGR